MACLDPLIRKDNCGSGDGSRQVADGKTRTSLGVVMALFEYHPTCKPGTSYFSASCSLLSGYCTMMAQPRNEACLCNNPFHYSDSPDHHHQHFVL
ncbi:hypothetical protein NW759_17762 [Fusarium solani]|nr:hypothetical protein NW759_17762 [Fusarium solani]